MATITLKINERTKAGQIFLAFVNQFVLSHKSIEIMNEPNDETKKSLANIEKKVGLTKTKSHADLMKKLNA